MPRALVLGVGNILMQDEGVGVRVVEWLQSRYRAANVTLLDGGTMGLDLLHYLPETDHLLIIDAVNSGASPGDLTVLTGKDVPAFLGTKISPHQIGVTDLLATAQLMGYTPPEVVILGVQPRSMQVGLEMSPEVEAAVERLGQMALHQLEQWGYHPVPLPAPH
ncbi:MAG: HyaD/HybD family hydrogenase maturation endopeptidase [Chloroflexi bacterium]|nr:MAG: HyaD/HybD family hydrogenase maturation endopeptidase [Chloroflexota bacterium]